MVSRCTTVTFQGMDPILIDVQVHISPGLPAFHIVGLGDKAVSESKERIRAAFHSMNISLPPERVVVNLAPADVPKEGSGYDVPIALAILSAMHVVDTENLSDYMALGEVGLDGRLLKVNGMLPASIAAMTHNKGLICAEQSLSEVRWSGLQSVIAAPSLLDVVRILKSGQLPNYNVSKTLPVAAQPKETCADFANVKGQRLAKRALEVAACGGHHALLVGPPGAGKSMLSSCFVNILPDLSPKQALDVTMIHSLYEGVPDPGVMTRPPYRDPHHTSTVAALTGGGMRCRPGEISLAHHGVLFLDEIAEFPSHVLEALRQPLETGSVSLARANHTVRYPAQFQCIAAMNPCKCGMFGQNTACSKAPACANTYQKRLSGPLLDRFDLKIYVDPVAPRDFLNAQHESEKSACIASRVENVRRYQSMRLFAHNHPHIQNPLRACAHTPIATHTYNAHLSANALKVLAPLSQNCQTLLIQAAERLNLSGRGMARTIKVARTIADMEELQHAQGVITDDMVRTPSVIQEQHMTEALQYRVL